MSTQVGLPASRGQRARPDLRPTTERRIARGLQFAKHGWWLLLPVIALKGRPASALAALLLCVLLEYARSRYETRRRAQQIDRFGGDDAHRLAEQIRNGWSTVTQFAAISYVYWRPSFYPCEGADCTAAKLDRLQHHLRGLGDRPWPPRLIEIEPHALGLALTVARTHGQTVEDYRRAAPRLASALGAIRVDVRAGRVDEVYLIVVIRSPLARPQPQSLAVPTGNPGDVQLGVREDGHPWVMRLQDSSATGVLVGGVPGAGKSGVIAALLAALVGRPGVGVAAVDLKGGVELGPWRPCMLTLATTLEDAVTVMEEGVQLLRQRYEVMSAEGVRHVVELSAARHHPMRVIVVDEAADLFVPAPGSRTDKELTDRALRAALTIARQGRAGAVILVLATQKPDSVAVPTALRDMLGHRIALRTSTRQHAETILGGLVDLAEVAWQIPPDAPGVALIAGSEAEPFLARANHVSNGDIKRIVEENTGHSRASGSPEDD